jgi:hypothetical protein
VGWEGEMMMMMMMMMMDGWMDGLVKNFDKAWFLQFAHLEFFPNGLTIDETLGKLH